MEPSILDSTKKVLGLSSDYTAFDLDVITFINAALTSVKQLGVGAPETSFVVGDATTTWESLGLSDDELSVVKVYVYLKVRMLFDPPTTSFLLDAINKMIVENEWKLTTHRETNPDTSYDEVEEEIEVI